MPTEIGSEHQIIKDYTVKNLIITIISTATIVGSVMSTYFNLKSNISDVQNHQETTERVNEIRLKVLEGEVSLMQQQIAEFKDNNAK